MDKVTILIIVLFWVVSAIFKAFQKSDKRESEKSLPPQRQKPPYQDKPEKKTIQIDELYELLEPQHPL